MQILTSMVKEDLDGTHTCSDEQQACNFCQNITLWHQLMSQVMCNFCPRDPAKIPTKEIPRVEEVKQVSASTSQSRKSQFCYQLYIYCNNLNTRTQARKLDNVSLPSKSKFFIYCSQIVTSFLGALGTIFGPKMTQFHRCYFIKVRHDS